MYNLEKYKETLRPLSWCDDGNDGNDDDGDDDGDDDRSNL